MVNLSLFLTPQQCTRARAGWPPPRSTKPTAGEHEDHIIRKRLNVYEFPEFSEESEWIPRCMSSDHKGHPPSRCGMKPYCVACSFGIKPLEAPDQHPFHCFAQHRSRPMGRLRTGIIVLARLRITFMAATFQAWESIPALGTYLPSLGTPQVPEDRSLAYVRREPINARGLEDETP
ncbi:hypothetical protein EVAR_86898_1 [Eumeta japonica]|uniref:Uncharacterized protein n=1 Tax=Eumeta variegata TaxID=151549 RepID=A0A4C1W559_EUMVA|nr:hypothetical protein EVAR_86898_1 [Eumeta japonica]